MQTLVSRCSFFIVSFVMEVGGGLRVVLYLLVHLWVLVADVDLHACFWRRLRWFVGDTGFGSWLFCAQLLSVHCRYA